MFEKGHLEHEKHITVDWLLQRIILTGFMVIMNLIHSWEIYKPINISRDGKPGYFSCFNS